MVGALDCIDRFNDEKGDELVVFLDDERDTDSALMGQQLSINKLAKWRASV